MSRTATDKAPLKSDIGSETDVEVTGESISPREIWAITVAGEPITSRKQRLRDMIEELRARIEASDRGHDLEPILAEAEAALRAVEKDEADETDDDAGQSDAARPD